MEDRPQERRPAVPRHHPPGGGRQRLRHLDRLRQPPLAGAVGRRRPGTDPPLSVRRGRLPAVRDDPAAATDRGRRRGDRPGPGGGRPWGGGGGRRLGQLVVAGELPRVRAYRAIRLSRWCGVGHPAGVCRPGTVAAQPVGPLGRLDDGAAGHRAECPRWGDRLPVPRPRPAPGHGTASPRDVRAVPRLTRRAAAGCRPRGRR
jgi:hypothetical protein